MQARSQKDGREGREDWIVTNETERKKKGGIKERDQVENGDRGKTDLLKRGGGTATKEEGQTKSKE